MANRDLDSVSEIVESKGPTIHDKVLVMARHLSEEELEDPELASLRKQIAEVFNETLEGEPVQSVGFYHFRYSIF